MNKLLSILLLSMLAGSAYAAPAPVIAIGSAPLQAQGIPQTNQVDPRSFQEKKQGAVDRMQHMQANLAKVLTCIQAAQNEEALRSCRLEFKSDPAVRPVNARPELRFGGNVKAAPAAGVAVVDPTTSHVMPDGHVMPNGQHMPTDQPHVEHFTAAPK